MPFVFPVISNAFRGCIVSNAIQMDALCNPSGFQPGFETEEALEVWRLYPRFTRHHWDWISQSRDTKIWHVVG
jgi:hypothetical protein